MHVEDMHPSMRDINPSVGVDACVQMHVSVHMDYLST